MTSLYLIALVGALSIEKYTAGFNIANKLFGLLAIYLLETFLLQSERREEARTRKAEDRENESSSEPECSSNRWAANRSRGVTRATIVLSPPQADGNMRGFQVPKEKALVLI